MSIDSLTDIFSNCIMIELSPIVNLYISSLPNHRSNYVSILIREVDTVYTVLNNWRVTSLALKPARSIVQKAGVPARNTK